MEKMMSKISNDTISANGGMLDMRNEMSCEELDAVTGGEVAVKIFGHKVTASDVADAAKWVWHKLF